MLARAPRHCSWDGSEQGIADLLVHIHIYSAHGCDDKRVSVLRLSSATQGGLVGLLGSHSAHGLINGVVASFTVEKLGGKRLHGIIPRKWL